MREKVIQLMAKVFVVEEKSIPNDISYGNHDKWDSIHHLNLIVELESQFGVFFEPEEIQEMINIEKIIQFLQLKINQ